MTSRSSWLLDTVSIDDGLRRRSDNFLLLRILAASMVIYGHARAIAPAVDGEDIFVRLGLGEYSGDIAVNIFFLVSGFLVTGSLMRQRNLLNFFKLRALRLVPGYAVNVLLLATVVGSIMTTLPVGEYLYRQEVWDYVYKNMRLSSDMVWKLPGVFETNAKTATINGSQWTLPAETRMYVLLGVAGLVGVFASLRVATIAVLGVVAIGALYPHYLPLHQDWFRLGFYFALGVLIYLHRESIRVGYIMLIGLVLLAVLTKHLPTYSLTFPLALSCFVFVFAYMTPVVGWLERFGDPSYGIYLWGWPCQQLVAFFYPSAGLLIHVGLATTMAIIIGYASWHMVEKHALKLK